MVTPVRQRRTLYRHSILPVMHWLLEIQLFPGPSRQSSDLSDLDIHDCSQRVQRTTDSWLQLSRSDKSDRMLCFAAA